MEKGDVVYYVNQDNNRLQKGVIIRYVGSEFYAIDDGLDSTQIHVSEMGLNPREAYEKYISIIEQSIDIMSNDIFEMSSERRKQRQLVSKLKVKAREEVSENG